MGDMAGPTTFLQKVFCEISLEKRPDLWQDDEDTEAKNIERIAFLASFPQTEYRAQLDPKKSTTRKNEVLAKALKEKGNKSYASGDNIEAMNHYNQALRFATVDQQGVILANRSALWSQLGEPHRVEEDVDLALEAGYPEELKFKLLERRAKARQTLGKLEEGVADVDDAVAALEKANLVQEKRDGKKAELQRLRKELSTALSGGGGSRESSPKPLEPLLPGENPKFPTFSDAVRIRYEEGRGRFAVAAREIKVGELIAKEKPYVSLLDRELVKSHCWHCLTCTKSPLPCPTCSGVQFCSRECRDKACTTYHKYECLFTDSLYQAQMGAWHLAFRAITLLPWAHYKENMDFFLSRHERSGEGEEGVYLTSNVASFHNLVTHDRVGKKQAPGLMMQCHVVVFLLRLLRSTGYITAEDGAGLELSEDELLAGRILHHFLRAAYYNTHEVSEVEKTGDRWSENRCRRVGRVTNPTLALINHSCDPNYHRVSNGNTTYGFATRNIPKGHEIVDTYCKPVAAESREERQAYLEKYNFACGCLACKQNWPTLGGMDTQFKGLPPSLYKQPANRVDAQAKRIQRAEEAFRKVDKPGAGVEEVVGKLVTIVEEVHKLVKGPHHAIAYWENQLHQALLHLYGAKTTSISSGLSVVTWPAANI